MSLLIKEFSVFFTTWSTTLQSKVGDKPKAQKAQSVETLLRTFMKRQKTSKHQNIKV